jgi:hypothetical protein
LRFVQRMCVRQMSGPRTINWMQSSIYLAACGSSAIQKVIKDESPNDGNEKLVNKDLVTVFGKKYVTQIRAWYGWSSKWFYSELVRRKVS